MEELLSPLLNEEERRLARTSPEESLRRALARGALSLDDMVPHLAPGAAEALRIIAGGERVLPGASGLAESDRGAAEVERVLQEPQSAGRGSAEAPAWARAFLDAHPGADHWFGGSAAPGRAAGEAGPSGWVDHFVAAYPEVTRLLAAGSLSPAAAMEAIQSIDVALGRYVTGTRYAAP